MNNYPESISEGLLAIQIKINEKSKAYLKNEAALAFF
jgi:hypothetical protein